MGATFLSISGRGAVLPTFTDQRAERRAAVFVSRYIWHHILIEGPAWARRVHLAERHASGEIDDEELESGYEALRVLSGAPPDPDALIERGQLEAARSAAARLAADVLCLPFSWDALESAVRATARVAACQELIEELEPEVLWQIRRCTEDPAMRERPAAIAAWRRYAGRVWPTVAAREHLFSAKVRDLVAGRIKADPDGWVGFTRSDTVHLFGLGLPHCLGWAEARPVADQDELLALVVQTWSLPRLWMKCRREDWRHWLVDVASRWDIIESTAIDGNPFERIDRTVLDRRKRLMTYCVHGSVERLTTRDIVAFMRAEDDED